MGRAPCCDKANVKKGPWSPEEDATLKAYIEANGTGGNWIALPQKIGLRRCGKSCRLRWLNYLRPNIKHGGFSEEEDNIICNLYFNIGSRWSIIASQLPGRTDNDIKNYWNTRLKKKFLAKQRKEQQARRAILISPKQEMTGETPYMVPGMVSQTPYWPQHPAAAATVLPLTNTYQENPHHLKNQESLGNFIKQEGRFCDNYMNFGYPLDVSFSQSQQQLYQNSMNFLSSESSFSPVNSNSSEVTNSTHFNVNQAAAAAGPNDMFQRLVDGYSAELSELIYSNNQQILYVGLDHHQGFYGTDNMVDGSSTGTSSVESGGWGDMNSLGYSQIVSGFEACQQQNMPQLSTFDESSYFRPQ